MHPPHPTHTPPTPAQPSVSFPFFILHFSSSIRLRFLTRGGYGFGLGTVVPLDEEAEEDDGEDEGGLGPEGGHLLCALGGREGGRELNE